MYIYIIGKIYAKNIFYAVYTLAMVWHLELWTIGRESSQYENCRFILSFADLDVKVVVYELAPLILSYIILQIVWKIIWMKLCSHNLILEKKILLE